MAAKRVRMTNTAAGTPKTVYRKMFKTTSPVIFELSSSLDHLSLQQHAYLKYEKIWELQSATHYLCIIPTTILKRTQNRFTPHGKWRILLKKKSVRLLYSIANWNRRPTDSGRSSITQHDVHESAHRDMIMKVTNKMQLYRLIYYT